jgi:flavin reductase (DIM6/NTAB) family NADH-FMN oxidoreductase RutF
MAVDPLLYKQVMRRFATGVMVLTVPTGSDNSGEGMHAITVNAVASVSLDPILMLVCIEKTAHSHGLIHQAGAFALNILTETQRQLGERFAYDWEARRHPGAFVQGHAGETGALIFEESLGFLECRVTAEYEGGDHTIFLGEVVKAAFKETSTGPLLYYGGKWLSLHNE